MTKVLRKPITKSELISEISSNQGIPKTTVTDIFALLLVITIDEVQKAGEFTIPGIGKLVLVNRKARMGRNPATGETIKIPAKRVLKFRISSVCKKAVLK